MSQISTPQLPPLEKSPRLLSLDVFRGGVIVAMLIVNNIANPAAVGYWWKHADWITGTQAQAFQQWWLTLRSGAWIDALTHFPLLMHCTLADYVMPWFMLIIGVAIPFSLAAARARNIPESSMWLRALRRAATLVLLGWAIDNSLFFAQWYHSADPGAILHFKLDMNVLQLLGISYFVARIFYELPLASRVLAALMLFIAHWALLRFYPQGTAPPGTLTEYHNAPLWIYTHWEIFRTIPLLPHVDLTLVGLLSVVPATATMLLGTWIGDYLLFADVPPIFKPRRMIFVGACGALLGFLWAFDLFFNKPRWSPPYLLYTSGVGAILIALLHIRIDQNRRQQFTRPFVVFGTNSIAAYWLSIMTKIWLLNVPTINGRSVEATIIASIEHLTGPHIGSWIFTLAYVALWWAILDFAYRRKIFWKL